MYKGHDFFLFLNLWTGFLFLKWKFPPFSSWWTPSYPSCFCSAWPPFWSPCLSFSPFQRALVISSLFSVSFHSFSNTYYVFTMRQILCSYCLPHILNIVVPQGSVLSPFSHFHFSHTLSLNDQPYSGDSTSLCLSVSLLIFSCVYPHICLNALWTL